MNQDEQDKRHKSNQNPGDINRGRTHSSDPLETDVFGHPIINLGLQNFQQLIHGPLKTIQGFANLLSSQEIQASQALRELQDANDELAFYYLEFSKPQQGPIFSEPDEPFKVRELMDQVISYLMTSLVRPKIDVLYTYSGNSHNYQIGNKKAIVSLIYNFLLNEVSNLLALQKAHEQDHTNPTQLARYSLFLEISDTASGVQIAPVFQDLVDRNNRESRSDKLTPKLLELIEHTGADILAGKLNINTETTTLNSQASFKKISARVICSNKQRLVAVTNRLESLGLEVTDADDSNCCFIDAQSLPALNQDASRLTAADFVFLFNYNRPPDNSRFIPLRYPIRQSQLTLELTRLYHKFLRDKATVAHIMVVDDSPQNQQLLVTLLHLLGIQTTSASDGIEAVALYGGHIDLIFMDLHMPRLNGFEAAAIIRNSAHPNVPIIALSSDISSNEISEALKFGINDIHIKPIDRTIIEQVLIQHIGFKPEDIAPEDHLRKPTSRSNYARDFGIIDIELSLQRADNRPELATEMLEVFMEALPLDLNKIDLALRTADFEVLAGVVHKLKGACSYCGLPKLEDSIRKLYTLLKNGTELKDIEGEHVNLSTGFPEPQLDTKTISALILVINQNAADLIKWHATNQKPFAVQSLNHQQSKAHRD